MTNSNWPEIKTGVVNVLVFFLICFLIAFVGSKSPGWLLLVCPVLVGTFAYFAGNKNREWGIFGAILGEIAALFWVLFGI